MSAEHNHPPRCCCSQNEGADVTRYEPCPACPEHGAFDHPALHPAGRLCEEAIDGWCKTCSTGWGPVYHRKPATPYTEQETTNG